MKQSDNLNMNLSISFSSAIVSSCLLKSENFFPLCFTSMVRVSKCLGVDCQGNYIIVRDIVYVLYTIDV